MCNPAPSRTPTGSPVQSPPDGLSPTARLVLLNGRLLGHGYGPTEAGHEALQRWISVRPLREAAAMLIAGARDGIEDTGGLAASGSFDDATTEKQTMYCLEEAERLMARIETILAG